MSINLIKLLDKKSLKTQPLELRKLCEKIFYSGKGLRPQLVSLVSQQIGLTNKQQLFLSRIIESIHNSSLLHDDFIDQAKLRHHNPTAWLEFSPSQAVLAGDYLLAKVILYLVEQNNLELLKHTSTVICNLTKGEFLQRELLNFKNKDIKKTNLVHKLKTGSLFTWCVQAPFIYKKRYNNQLLYILDQVGSNMGLLFQRSDDLIDFNIRNKHKKLYLVDIKESYFNSFACFLIKNSTFKQQEQLKKVKSIKAVHQIFPNFKNKVTEFDAINSKLIKKTEKLLDQKLKPLLQKKEQNLVVLLKEFLSSFYWR